MKVGYPSSNFPSHIFPTEVGRSRFILSSRSKGQWIKEKVAKQLSKLYKYEINCVPIDRHM